MRSENQAGVDLCAFVEAGRLLKNVPGQGALLAPTGTTAHYVEEKDE
jgi:hypothetical protein